MSVDLYAPAPPKRCFFWSHVWSKWIDVASGNMRSGHTGRITGRFVDQTRVCQNCNKRQLRSITA